MLLLIRPKTKKQKEKGSMYSPNQERSTGPIAARYDALKNERAPYITRAEQCAAHTIPYAFAREATKGNRSSDNRVKYQSIGAEGVQNLTTRLATVILPPGSPPFKLTSPRPAPGEDQAQMALNAREIDAELSRIERIVLDHIESRGDRAIIYQACTQLLIAGNVLLRVQEKGSRIYPLHSYVVTRDGRGEVSEIIVREEITARDITASNEALARIKAHEIENNTPHQPQDHPRPRKYPLYTQIKKEEKGYKITQELLGSPLGKPGFEKMTTCTWLPLRLYQVPGEHYGRSHVEHYLGDHHTLEALTKATTELSAAAAKTLFLVRPGSMTNVRDLQRAGNLDFVAGIPQDITPLRIDKLGDLQTANTTYERIHQRLNRVYLLRSAIQRNAERVTAEEIRYMAQELETVLGGLYSSVAQEFQRPYVLLLLHHLSQKGAIPPIADLVDIQIVTGIDALGRGQDANKLIDYAGTLSRVFGAPQTLQHLNIPAYMKALAGAMGIDDLAILKTQEQLDQETMQHQQQTMEQTIAPPTIQALGGIAKQALAQDPDALAGAADLAQALPTEE